MRVAGPGRRRRSWPAARQFCLVLLVLAPRAPQSPHSACRSSLRSTHPPCPPDTCRERPLRAAKRSGPHGVAVQARRAPVAPIWPSRPAPWVLGGSLLGSLVGVGGRAGGREERARVGTWHGGAPSTSLSLLGIRGLTCKTCRRSKSPSAVGRPPRARAVRVGRRMVGGRGHARVAAPAWRCCCAARGQARRFGRRRAGSRARRSPAGLARGGGVVVVLCWSPPGAAPDVVRGRRAGSGIVCTCTHKARRRVWLVTLYSALRRCYHDDV